MEILATIPIYTHPWFYNLLFAVAVLFLVGGIMSCILSIEMRNWTSAFIGFVLIIVGSFGVAHTLDAIERTSFLDYNKYKVTIDETVNARELLDKYEILSHEGEIFIIKEIEVDE